MSPKLQRAERARLYVLWDHLAERLNASAALSAALRGDPARNPARARVFTPDDDMGGELGAEGTAWGRGLFLPGEGITAPNPLTPGRRLRRSLFTLRFDLNEIADPGFVPGRTLERAHIEAFNLLHGYRPTGLQGVVVAVPIALVRPWQDAPLRDPDGTMWYLSAEYAFQATETPLP